MEFSALRKTRILPVKQTKTKKFCHFLGLSPRGFVWLTFDA